MTELEMIEQAKMYLDKIANGIDPLTDKPVSDDDLINNVRISRCLFFVSDVLRRVLENGGIGKKQQVKKPDKQPFSLSTEKIASFELSSVGIGVGDLTNRINMLVDKERMKVLKANAITDWFVEIGYLERHYDSYGHEYKRPTQSGAELGLKLDTRNFEGRTYEVVTYGVEAQRFILDNLEAIVAAENARRCRQGEPWSENEDECLKDLMRKNVPIGEISITLKRESSGVRSRAKKLGLIGSISQQ